jgi:hypothetical protein
MEETGEQGNGQETSQWTACDGKKQKGNGHRGELTGALHVGNTCLDSVQHGAFTSRCVVLPKSRELDGVDISWNYTCYWPIL